MTRISLAIQQINDELAMHREAIETLTKHKKELEKDMEKENGKLQAVRTGRSGKEKAGDFKAVSV